MRRTLGAIVAVVAVWACGGATFTGGPDGGDGGSSSSSGSSGSSSSSGSSGSSGSSSGSSGSSSGSSSGGSSGSSSGGVGPVPTDHRPNDDQCLTTPPAGNCPIQTGNPGECTGDSSCTDGGTNGRCVESGGGVLYCSCTYDTCAQDSACPTNQTCACHGSPYTDNQGNTCVQGNCRVDSDCEGGAGYCSPAENTMSCGSLLGYYCHTPQDQCTNDSDCSGGTMGPQVCTYVAGDSRWECKVYGLCG